MSQDNFIKKLLNIKEKNLEITNVIEENIKGITHKVICATSINSDIPLCPCCSNKLVKNGTKTVNIKILKNSEYFSILRLKKQKYLCKNCKKTLFQELDLVNKNSSISNDLKLAVMLNLKETKTIKSIAKDFNISQSTVMRILDKLDDYKVDYTFLPEKLCFDEFKSTKNIKGSISFVYCNAETSEIIDIMEDRRLQSLKEYFSRFPKEVRNKVKHVVIDIYKPYISLLQEMFPKAKISIDRFAINQ